MRAPSMLTALLLIPIVLTFATTGANAEGPGRIGAVVAGSTGVVGGISIDLDEEPNGTASVTTGDIAAAEWPTIAEVYTAIWCENCPAFEATLLGGHDARVAAGEPGLTMLHFHREKGETQDPFGTLEGDEWWIRRYGATSSEETLSERQPPSVVFEGERFHAGGRAKGNGTLLDDFNASIDAGRSIDTTSASSTLKWNDIDGDGEARNGTAVWETTLAPPSGGSIESHLMVVERLATLTWSGETIDHPHIVRAIHPLGDGGSGSLPITLPDPHDGADLTLVLVHEWLADPSECSDCEEGGSIPAPGLKLTVFATALAAFWAERRVRRDAAASTKAHPRE